MSFDPNAAAAKDSGVFGLPYTEKEAKVIYVPVPWEATTSYGGGTSEGPSAILQASHQVDLYDSEIVRPYEAGLYMLPESSEIRQLNATAKEAAQKVILSDHPSDGSNKGLLDKVNTLSEKLNQWVYLQTKRLLVQEKLVAIVGGDHSVPFGALQAIAEKHSNFGILHFDAHSDTRDAYEGFQWSHASIMRNVLDRIPQVSRLVQVGIRDFCEQEAEYCAQQRTRVRTFLDKEIKKSKYDGVSWKSLCQEIVAALPNEVWISFDIDGLDPRFCPSTGTPVPGGLDFDEATYLISLVALSGRKIIGFDLNEVSPDLGCPDDEWDANVGARLLYKMTAWTLKSQDLRIAQGG